MSRRKNNSSITARSDGLPPSHPIEANKEHRNFLLRSLDRNDKEMAAIIEINRVLAKSKQYIIEHCGEKTLIDLGLGKITIKGDPGEETLQGEELPATGQDYCIEFLLHMKLRRRLLNRLIRRLHRIAHAMDGEDIQPPPPPKYGELPLHIDPQALEEFQKHFERQEMARQTLEAKIEAETNPEAATETVPDVDYKAFMDYKDGYEKTINKETDETQYVVLQQNREEDYVIMKDTNGIGAMGRPMTIKEKEAEFTRWKTALLSKIPDQPTFGDLGLEHRVFALEERRKRAAEEQPSTPSKKMKSEDEQEPESSPAKSDTTDKKSPKQETKDDNKDDDEDDEEIEELPTIVKPISLAAVPSFYDQDQRRIRLVHMTLMGSSLRNHARSRLEEVINEYNKALQASMSSRQALQTIVNQVNAFKYEQRGKFKGADEQYAEDLQIAKNRWTQKRKEYEHRKLDRCLPSRWGRVPEGTNATKSYANQPNAIFPQIATCVADIVDAAVNESVKFIEKMEPFVPPQRAQFSDFVVDQASGETLIQRNKRLLQGMEERAKEAQNELYQKEEERNRLWRKMIKTKSEFDIPQITSRGRMPVTTHNLHQFSMPSLHESRAEYVPSIGPQASAATPSYVPSTVRRNHDPNESKYSTARVRERIGADGSVAPVSEPKRDSYGLFLRPAGRQRKGMEWDAVRGIWVPVNQN